MQTVNETWKWGVVCILLAIFLLTASQAYQHVTSQEHFEPPDDYLQGDSWDIEHKTGPGSGQAISFPSDYSPTGSSSVPDSEIPTEETEPIILDSEIDWNQVQDPSGD